MTSITNTVDQQSNQKPIEISILKDGEEVEKKDGSFVFSSFYSATPFEIPEEELSRFEEGNMVCLGQFISKLEITEDRKYYISPIQDTSLDTIVLFASRKITLLNDDDTEKTDFYQNNLIEIHPDLKFPSEIVYYLNFEKNDLDKGLNLLLDMHLWQKKITEEVRKKYENITIEQLKEKNLVISLFFINELKDLDKLNEIYQDAKDFEEEFKNEDNEDKIKNNLYLRVLKIMPFDVIFFVNTFAYLK